MEPARRQALLQLPADPAQWAEFYRRHLLAFVMPFWLRHAVDEKHGGLFTCLADDGRIESTEKYVWSQARALWTFSALHRRIEPRSDWLTLARRQFEFCRDHCFDAGYNWHFRTTREGALIDGALSIVTDCFGILGMVEYARITSDPEAIEIARRTYVSIQDRLGGNRPFGTAPYPLPAGLQAHRYSMQTSLAFHELGTLLQNDEILAAGWSRTRNVMDHFVRPEHEALVEYANLDGTFSDTPAGRTMVPGHGIESMWFQLHIFRERGRPADLPLALAAMEWCLRRGWDPVYGGLYLGLDIFGREPVFWKFPTAKIWWVAAEALAATLVAYEAQPDAKWLIHHRRIVDWALQKFPVPAHGEWHQRLDRQGKVMQEIIALPVKDPFHLPRALMVAIEALDRLARSKSLASIPLPRVHAP